MTKLILSLVLLAACTTQAQTADHFSPTGKYDTIPIVALVSERCRCADKSFTDPKSIDGYVVKRKYFNSWSRTEIWKDVEFLDWQKTPLRIEQMVWIYKLKSEVMKY